MSKVPGCTCQRCGCVFEGDSSNPNRFCSTECYRMSRREAPAPGKKECRGCRLVLPIEDFGASQRLNRVAGKVYYSTYCLACRRARTEPAVTRRASLKKRYGITPEDFERMLAEQGGCAACGSPTTDGKYWHIDHDHTCCPSSSRTCGKCIRGILCHGCNTALGNLGDDPVRVARLLHYAEGFAHAAR